MSQGAGATIAELRDLFGSGQSCPLYASPVAAGLAPLRTQTLVTAPVLADYVEPSVADLLRQLADGVGRRMLRIAVIGQVKAGKSTFVNALVQRPGLLPTDVNPWTAVVTRLHLGHPNGRTAGAQFRFFDNDEWRELSEAGGQLRIVAERLVPELDLDVFRSQLMEIRARAQRRLGDDFIRLIGTTHDFEALQPGQLASYVAAGDDFGVASPAKAPVYSDVTSSADVFLDREPFDVPLTVIDTPGTNDPFLVRDEITLRSLDEADVTIMVLSARQALTVADVALMRALAGVHKTRLVVYVNRCDEVAGEDGAVEAIRAHVENFLLNEFGETIPVVAGSALWANAACSGDLDTLRKLVDCGLAAKAARLGAAIDAGVAEWRKAPEQQPVEPVLDMLMSASGLPQLVAEIERKVTGSPFAETVRSAHDALIRVAAHQENVARQELHLHEEGLKQAHFDAMSAGLEVQRLNQAAHRLEVATQKLAEIAGERRAEIEAAQRQGLVTLRKALLDQVDAHLARERTNYMVALDKQQPTTSKGLKLDISRLRKSLEQVFITEYKVLHTRVSGIQASARSTFRRVVAEELPRTDLEVHAVAMTNSFTFPSLAALRRVNSFHVDPKLWAAWRRRQTSLVAALEEFETIVRREFTEVVDELTRAADKGIATTLAELQQQLDQSVNTAVRVANLHREAVAERLDAIAREGTAPNRLDDHLDRLGTARARLIALQNLCRMLENGPVETHANREAAFT